MRQLLLSFFVFSIWATLASTYYTCVIKGLCISNDTTTESKKPNIIQKNKKDSNTLTKTITTPLNSKTDTINEFATIKGKLDSTKTATDHLKNLNDSLKPSQLNVFYKDELVIHFASNFRIYENSDRIQIPFGISTYGHAIAKEMNTKNLLLTITSYYNKNETSEIGKNRARGMAERLIKLGIHDSLITTKTQHALFDFNKGKFKGGITFSFQSSKMPVNLKHIDYTSVEIPIVEKIEFDNTQITYPKIANTTPEIEISKKEIPKTITQSTDLKEKTSVQKEISIITKSFTVTQLNFKNAKFKGSRGLKTFITENKSAKKIRLIGYTNESENPVDNYQAGLALATSVKSYILKKGFSNAIISTTALKTQKKGIPLDFGVTLLIE